MTTPRWIVEALEAALPHRGIVAEHWDSGVKRIASALIERLPLESMGRENSLTGLARALSDGDPEVVQLAEIYQNLSDECDLIALQFDAAGIDRSLPLAHQAQLLQEQHHALRQRLAERKPLTADEVRDLAMSAALDVLGRGHIERMQQASRIGAAIAERLAGAVVGPIPEEREAELRDAFLDGMAWAYGRSRISIDQSREQAAAEYARSKFPLATGQSAAELTEQLARSVVAEERSPRLPDACTTAMLDLAARNEGHLSPDGERRLCAHLAGCERCRVVSADATPPAAAREEREAMLNIRSLVQHRNAHDPHCPGLWEREIALLDRLLAAPRSLLVQNAIGIRPDDAAILIEALDCYRRMYLHSKPERADIERICAQLSACQ